MKHFCNNSLITRQQAQQANSLKTRWLDPQPPDLWQLIHLVEDARNSILKKK